MVPANTPAGRGTPADRKRAFRALVAAQDRGLSVRDARQTVAEEFRLTDAQLRAIEDEGVRKDWPPL